MRRYGKIYEERRFWGDMRNLGNIRKNQVITTYKEI